MTPEEKAFRQHTTLLDIQGSEVDGRFASGKTFRREYKLNARKAYIDGGGTFADELAEADFMKDLQDEADALFKHDGDYKIQYGTNAIQYLGEF